MRVQIAKVNQTISRLIDGYTEGLINKDEFTLRIRRAKDRSAHLAGQLQSHADLTAQRRELLLIITRLQDFTSRIKEGLQQADRGTKRDLVRALVRRVEIGPDGVNVIFRVDPAIPSVPPVGIMPDCTREKTKTFGKYWYFESHILNSLSFRGVTRSSPHSASRTPRSKKTGPRLAA